MIREIREFDLSLRTNPVFRAHVLTTLVMITTPVMTLAGMAWWLQFDKIAYLLFLFGGILTYIVVELELFMIDRADMQAIAEKGIKHILWMSFKSFLIPFILWLWNGETETQLLSALLYWLPIAIMYGLSLVVAGSSRWDNLLSEE